MGTGSTGPRGVNAGTEAGTSGGPTGGPAGGPTGIDAGTAARHDSSLEPDDPFLSRSIGRHPDVQAVSIILLFGCLLLVLGLDVVRQSDKWGFTISGAVAGIQSQLGVTGPAAVLVAIATAANIFAGAVVLRLLGTPPFRSFSDLVLAGFAAAVVLDTAALLLLGSLGLFRLPELLALHAAAVLAYLATRRRLPLLRGPIRLRASVPAAWWLLVGAVWVGPLIVQLASPAVPFFDVLPNHVAPVEHVRVFGSFATLTTSPSPIYGPSRLMLGYVGLLGNLTTITNLEAVLAVAAFATPLTILMALAVRQFATRLFGRVAGFWIMLTFPLTFAFVRLPDARAAVAVIPLALWALGSLARELRPEDRAMQPRSLGATPSALPSNDGRPDLALAVAFGAAILIHPLIGVVAFAAALAALLVEPDRLGRRLVPALAGGAVIALPQAATMLGQSLPSWAGVICLVAAVPVAFGVAFALARIVVPWRLLAAIAMAAAMVGLIVIARPVLPNLAAPGQKLPTDFPLLTLVCLVGVVLSARAQRNGWTILGCGAVAGLAAWTAAGVVPSQTLTQQAIHYEVPKAIEYWLPVMLAVGAAGGLAAVYRWRALGPLRLALMAAFVLVSIYPLTGSLTTNVAIGEHRGAESLGLALREAERGYWAAFPDSRHIIDASQQQVVDAIRAEEDAGRLGPSTRVLHIASSFQQWVSVPLGVFDGAMETSISLTPELSIHTEGGRLLGFDQLDRELTSDYGYVVLEPARLPADLTGTIAAAGYHQIWSNSRAIIYARN